MVIIVLGLPGSGKSYFATQLAKELHGAYLSSDEVRNHLNKRGKYDDQSKLKVYHAMLEQMEAGLKNNRTIVVDGTFYRENIRNLFDEKIRQLGHKLHFVEIKASEEVVKKRLNKQRQESDANFDVYLKIKNEFEPLQEPHLTLFSDQMPIKQMLAEAMNYIQHTE